MGRRPTVSLRFGSSPEEQREAHGIMSAIREGMIERGELEPTTDEERQLRADYLASEVKRILLWGLPWQSDGKGTSCYRAQDGDRQWAVGRGVENGGRTWGATLHDGREGSPHIIASGLRTLREAKTACEEAARRLEGPGT